MKEITIIMVNRIIHGAYHHHHHRHYHCHQYQYCIVSSPTCRTQHSHPFPCLACCLPKWTLTVRACVWGGGRDDIVCVRDNADGGCVCMRVCVVCVCVCVCVCARESEREREREMCMPAVCVRAPVSDVRRSCSTIQRSARVKCACCATTRCVDSAYLPCTETTIHIR